MVRIGTNYDRPTFWPVLSPHGGENPEKQAKMARFGPFWPVFSVQSLRNLLQSSYSGPSGSKRSKTFATRSVPTARNFLPSHRLSVSPPAASTPTFRPENGLFGPLLTSRPPGPPAVQKATVQPGRISETRPLRAEPTWSKTMVLVAKVVCTAP